MAGRDDRPAKAEFEISGADLKALEAESSALDAGGASAFGMRGLPVMLAADVAVIFGVETREIVQNVKANPDFFPERYAFQLTAEETEGLRSAGLISKPGRGGSRALPWVVTRKGAIRLATIMKSERAMRAADIFIDIFDEVVEQVAAGSRALAITNPSRIAPSEEDRSMIEGVRDQLRKATRSLLDTVVDESANTTVADELQQVSAEAVGHVKAWLRGKSVANSKIEAETLLIIEQARDLYERRQEDLKDRAVERIMKKIEVAERVMALYRNLEPNALVELADGFAGQARLAAPERGEG